MVAIKELLDKQGVAYSDAKLAWDESPSTSKYADELQKCNNLQQSVINQKLEEFLSLNK